MNDEIYNLQISKQFLKNVNKLTKMSIKVYLSLVFLKYKRGYLFEASHYEISINMFHDNSCMRSGEWFTIRTDEGQYFKAFKQLETLGLIKVYRSKSKNGGNNVNQYKVF